MFPKLILALLLSVYADHLSAQKYFAVKAGTNFSVASTLGADNVSIREGYQIGVAGNLKLSSSGVLQPELVYANLGYKSKDRNDLKHNFHYITIPLLLKYQYKSFFFSFGPQGGFLFAANVLDNKTKVRRDVTEQMSSLVVSLSNGVGFMATKRIGVEGRFIFDMVSASIDTDLDLRNNSVQLSVFYVIP